MNHNNLKVGSLELSLTFVKPSTLNLQTWRRGVTCNCSTGSFTFRPSHPANLTTTSINLPSSFSVRSSISHEYCSKHRRHYCKTESSAKRTSSISNDLESFPNLSRAISRGTSQEQLSTSKYRDLQKRSQSTDFTTGSIHRRRAVHSRPL